MGSNWRHDSFSRKSTTSLRSATVTFLRLFAAERQVNPACQKTDLILLEGIIWCLQGTLAIGGKNAPNIFEDREDVVRAHKTAAYFVDPPLSAGRPSLTAASRRRRRAATQSYQIPALRSPCCNCGQNSALISSRARTNWVLASAVSQRC